MEKKQMKIGEIYGTYYATVAAILSEAVHGSLTADGITRIVQEKAFGESLLSIPGYLKDGTWPLLTPDLHTPLHHEPAMPLTLLQKRWMKALLLDPRIALFDPDPTGLEEIKPLFRPETIVFYDRYTDGDDYQDPVYVTHFRQALSALENHRQIRIHYRSGRGREHRVLCTPYRMEYSPRDDKFRLLVCAPSTSIVNISRILSLEEIPDCAELESPPCSRQRKALVAEIVDDRNALERAMLHFSYLEKETERIGQKRYRMTLWYDREEEPEVLIQALSFGPFLRVLEPEDLVRQIRERLQKQTAAAAFFVSSSTCEAEKNETDS